jgi:hypothetical protein
MKEDAENNQQKMAVNWQPFIKLLTVSFALAIASSSYRKIGFHPRTVNGFIRNTSEVTSPFLDG